MSLPKLLDDLRYEDRFGAKEQEAIFDAIEAMHDALTSINEIYTEDQNEDCRGCDFGPVQSTQHIEGCDYLVAHKALARVEELRKEAQC